MPFTGHCNCERVRISLAEKPANSVVCHCSNCKRAGGPFSVNLVVDESDISIEDATGLKIYDDSRTRSGNTVQRKFCSNCGSPIMTISPSFPEKAFLKASLFDEIPLPGGQLHTESQEAWVRVEERGKL